MSAAACVRARDQPRGPDRSDLAGTAVALERLEGAAEESHRHGHSHHPSSPGSRMAKGISSREKAVEPQSKSPLNRDTATILVAQGVPLSRYHPNQQLTATLQPLLLQRLSRCRGLEVPLPRHTAQRRRRNL